MNKFLSRILPCNIKTFIAYYETKLSIKFQLKDQTKKDHQHGVVYHAKWPEKQCTEDYTGETVSHLFKHSV